MKKTPEARMMSDEAVKAKTGKVWAEWFKILDSAGAEKMRHKDIARYLYEKRKLSSWWAQMVTVEYERGRGLREKYETSEGFAASASRTVAANLAKVYRAWADEKVRRRWLRDPRLEISSTTPNKSMRISWEGGKSRVDVMFYRKGKNKSQVAVGHRRLRNAAEVRRIKAHWSAVLDRMQAALKG